MAAAQFDNDIAEKTRLEVEKSKVEQDGLGAIKTYLKDLIDVSSSMSSNGIEQMIISVYVDILVMGVTICSTLVDPPKQPIFTKAPWDWRPSVPDSVLCSLLPPVVNHGHFRHTKQFRSNNVRVLFALMLHLAARGYTETAKAMLEDCLFEPNTTDGSGSSKPRTQPKTLAEILTRGVLFGIPRICSDAGLQFIYERKGGGKPVDQQFLRLLFWSGYISVNDNENTWMVPQTVPQTMKDDVDQLLTSNKPNGEIIMHMLSCDPSYLGIVANRLQDLWRLWNCVDSSYIIRLETLQLAREQRMLAAVASRLVYLSYCPDSTAHAAQLMIAKVAFGCELVTSYVECVTAMYENRWSLEMPCNKVVRSLVHVPRHVLGLLRGASLHDIGLYGCIINHEYWTKADAVHLLEHSSWTEKVFLVERGLLIYACMLVSQQAMPTEFVNEDLSWLAKQLKQQQEIRGSSSVDQPCCIGSVIKLFDVIANAESFLSDPYIESRHAVVLKGLINVLTQDVDEVDLIKYMEEATEKTELVACFLAKHRPILSIILERITITNRTLFLFNLVCVLVKRLGVCAMDDLLQVGPSEQLTAMLLDMFSAQAEALYNAHGRQVAWVDVMRWSYGKTSSDNIPFAKLMGGESLWSWYIDHHNEAEPSKYPSLQQIMPAISDKELERLQSIEAQRHSGVDVKKFFTSTHT